MAVQLYLVKRALGKKARNGRAKYRWAIRWKDPATGKWRCESTGTADRAQADDLLKLRWSELNGLREPEAKPDPQPEAPPGASWQECRDALERAMKADNLRPSYVSDALLMFDGLQRMFPQAGTPAGITAAMANEFKRIRAEKPSSPWTIKGDLATLRAVFGKWLVAECGLLQLNPFEGIKPPRCDDPEIRIVSAAETMSLHKWLGDRWNNWRIPLTYLQVASLIGWRATELASLRTEDLLEDGHIRVVAQSSKTRKHKQGWLPPGLYGDVQACGAGGWAFGRFSDELRRLLILWRKQPHHAAKVKDFTPARLVGWIQDELQRFNAEMAAAAEKVGGSWESFTLHDFRRTAITGLQAMGASEKDTSLLVGATPEVMRRHYEKFDQQALARRLVMQRLAGGVAGIQEQQSLRAPCAQGGNDRLDDRQKMSQASGA